jgi:hypothetical protein
MNEGWVINHGEFYIKHEAVALKFAKGHGYKSLQDFYDTQEKLGHDAFYWTDWDVCEEEDDGWYESDFEDGRNAVWVDAY